MRIDGMSVLAATFDNDTFAIRRYYVVAPNATHDYKFPPRGPFTLEAVQVYLRLVAK